ncbi:MAG: hypothetical protein HY901_26410, partial [Deltaproteobacteria bacterium]|nr:hypothetical protein [Deltaproteobacteria bacterium]
MLAFRLGFSRTSSAKHEDPVALSNEEANLESLEAQLSAKLAELERREEAMIRTVEEERQELVALSRSRAGGMVPEALSRFPAHFAPRASPVHERQKACEMRRAAL